MNTGTLTGDQLNSIGQQSGYTGGSFGNTGLSQTQQVSNTSLGLPPPSQTQDASLINNQMTNGQTTQFPPPPPAPTSGVSDNASITNPNASVQEIINQGNQTTPAEATNKTLLDRVAALIGQKKGQTTLTNTAETAAGVPGLQKTYSELNTQLEGINNQSLDLQNQARPGGAIENKEQQDILGRGVTAAGLAPISAGDLRKNQIQQSALASRALTLKSAIYGAQGNLTLAKDAADKAATAQYEDQQNQIDYQKALIDANMPQMTKEEKNQALVVQTQLQDRQKKIDEAIDNKKTIIAMATKLISDNPGDPTAQYAAQQILSESNNPNPDLSKIFSYAGQVTGGANLNVQANTRTTTSGITYVDGTNLTGKDAQAAMHVAAQQGIPYLDKTSADLQNNVETARENMQNIQQTLQGLLPASGAQVGIKLENLLESSTQIGPNADALASFNAYRSAAIQALRAMAGAKGLRINQAEIMQSVNNDIPKITDTVGVAQKKIEIVNSLLNSQEKGTFGSQYYTPTSNTGTTVMTGPGGTFNVPNDQVDKFKENGYK